MSQPGLQSPWNSASRPWLLLGLTAIAILFGLYGRFTGLGLWPFGVDEFYISRSIDNVLRAGVPEFLCGGYYTRGVLYQYIVAGLRLTGLTPEFAGRIVSAVASLSVLPAAYILGKRLRNSTVGLLAVLILALSIWEIEMARFARMYAPFQAVFLWYVVCFIRYTIDGNRKALTGMIVLSFAGVALWEGGAILGLTNFLPPFFNHERGRLRRGSWIYLAGMAVVFALLYGSTADLRGFAELPPGFIETGTDAEEVPRLFQTLIHHTGWIVGFLLPLLISALNFSWLSGMRSRVLTALGLSVALLCMLAHQFSLAAGLVILLLLSRLIEGRELVPRKAVFFWLTLLSCAIFWAAYGHFAEPALAGNLQLLGRQLLGFPDVLEKIFRPWARSIPWTGLLLIIALGGMTIRTALRPTSVAAADNALLLLVISLLLAVGAASFERLETRYTFFLYPLLIVLGIAAISSLIERISNSGRVASIGTIVVALILFFVADDFQPDHLINIGSARVNFRIGMSAGQQNHYYPRNDIKGTASWLTEHVQSGDLVITSVPSLTAYYSPVDYFYLADNDPRYGIYVCGNGKNERWSNLALAYSSAGLASKVTPERRVFFVNYHDPVHPESRPIADPAVQAKHVFTSMDDSIDIFVLTR